MKTDLPQRLGPQVVKLFRAEVWKWTLEVLLEVTRHFTGLD